MNEIVGSMLMPFGVAVGGAVLGLLIAWRFLKARRERVHHATCGSR